MCWTFYCNICLFHYCDWRRGWWWTNILGSGRLYSYLFSNILTTQTLYWRLLFIRSIQILFLSNWRRGWNICSPLFWWWLRGCYRFLCFLLMILLIFKCLSFFRRWRWRGVLLLLNNRLRLPGHWYSWALLLCVFILLIIIFKSNIFWNSRLFCISFNIGWNLLRFGIFYISLLFLLPLIHYRKIYNNLILSF